MAVPIRRRCHADIAPEPCLDEGCPCTTSVDCGPGQGCDAETGGCFALECLGFLATWLVIDLIYAAATGRLKAPADNTSSDEA